MKKSSSTVAASAAQKVEMLPIGMLVPSPNNPRKTMDESFLAQLADSIKQLGIQVPLLVRGLRAVSIEFEDGSTIDGPPAPRSEYSELLKRKDVVRAEVDDEHYEIVAGHRRFAAAQKLKLESLPCIVREMSDEDALQVMIVENLQRADLSPMEEADGYRVLIRAMGDPDPQACIEEIARKTGKPGSYVRSRLKLLGLIAPAQEALREQLITFDAAMLIAKLEPADQDNATARALNLQRGAETAQQALDGARANIADDKEWRAEHPDEDEEPAHEPLSAARLKAWIAENILLDLAKAPWPLEDAGILTEAGPCTTCPKRAGSNQALFADLTAKQDVCTDPACFSAKRKAFVQIQKSAAKASGKPVVKISDSFSQAPISEGSELEKTTFKNGQWVEAKEGECADTYRGLTSEGELRWVCVDQKCKVHKHTVVKPAAQYDWRADQAKREAKAKEYAERELPVREAVAAAIRKDGRVKTDELLRFLLMRYAADLRDCRRLGERRGVKLKQALDSHSIIAAMRKAKPAELPAWVQDALVESAVLPAGHKHDDVAQDRADLWEVANLYGVNADAIAKKFESKPKPEKSSSKAPANHPNGKSKPLGVPAKKPTSSPGKAHVSKSRRGAPGKKSGAKKGGRR